MTYARHEIKIHDWHVIDIHNRHAMEICVMAIAIPELQHQVFKY